MMPGNASARRSRQSAVGVRLFVGVMLVAGCIEGIAVAPDGGDMAYPADRGLVERGVAIDGSRVSDGATGADLPPVVDASGLCISNAECDDPNRPPVHYCQQALGCTGAGVCVLRPALTDCPLLLEIVCGCDGNTYGNACEAAAAGVNVERTADTCVPVTNGCASNDVCGPGWFCNLDLICEVVGGACEPRPTDCTGAAPGIVCGCDEIEYPSACHAHLLGVSVAKVGDCG